MDMRKEDPETFRFFVQWLYNAKTEGYKAVKHIKTCIKGVSLVAPLSATV